MGRAGAIRFAQEGAAVAVVDLNEAAASAVAKSITDAGGRAIALAGDLRQDEFARAIVRDTTRAFGALDFVWNHVGHPGPAAIEGVDWKEFELAMDLNVRSVLVTTEAALPELRARGGGALLFTASTSGLTGSQFSPIYNIAKFGIVGLVHGLAKRYAREKIRVNAVCPGPVDTPMLRVFVARPDSQLPAGRNGGIAGAETRRPGADRTARATRGNRQRGAVPDLRRGILYHRSGAAGGWWRHRLSRARTGPCAPVRRCPWF
jgi:NAD(P)-dependent dehydrogenase (short-subunit alcohol dehydrogenase family)